MTQEWASPDLIQLHIAATAGGPYPVYDQDGDKWWNPDRSEQGEWEIPIGQPGFVPSLSE